MGVAGKEGSTVTPRGSLPAKEGLVTAFAASKAFDLARGGKVVVWVGGGGEVVRRDEDENGLPEPRESSAPCVEVR